MRMLPIHEARHDADKSAIGRNSDRDGRHLDPATNYY